MARKPTEFVQFKLRIREALRRKIERDAEKKAISANAEAIERLEASYEVDRRTDEQAQALQRQLLDNQKKLEETQATARRLELTVQQADQTLKIISALTGNNPASYHLIQRVAIEAATNPEWDRSESGRQAIAVKIYAYIVNPTGEASE